MSKCGPAIASVWLLVVVAAQQGAITPKKGERMYNKITANLMVSNVSETLDFYERVLGFGMVMAVPEDSRQIITVRKEGTPLDFAVVRRDEVELMFQSRKSLSQTLSLLADRPLGGSITLYVEVTNAKELYASIKNKVTMVKDLHTTFYGMQEFYIRDCNGYILTFASRQ